MTHFLHTADWQIGKPFQSIADSSKREALRNHRVETIRGLRKVIEANKLSFVIVAGDLFDSFTPDKATVAAFCSAVGSLKVPVYAIPGNHDHGGTGCIWNQAFFTQEREQLAPNLHLLLEPEPIVIDEAVLLPCPLLRRHQTSDPTAWIRAVDFSALPNDRPRIVIAHGSTQGFSSTSEEDTGSATNLLDIDALPNDQIDYIALGDWHGTKEIKANAWYSGTPEQDRFAKGDDNQPGNALVVSLKERGDSAQIERIATGGIHWHEITTDLENDAALDELRSTLDDKVEGDANRDLLKLTITGTLSLRGADALERLLESYTARTIHLRQHCDITVEPSEEELAKLTDRDDPLVSHVAQQLHQEAQLDTASGKLAKAALRELHLQLQHVQPQTTN